MEHVGLLISNRLVISVFPGTGGHGDQRTGRAV